MRRGKKRRVQISFQQKMVAEMEWAEGGHPLLLLKFSKAEANPWWRRCPEGKAVGGGKRRGGAERRGPSQTARRGVSYTMKGGGRIGGAPGRKQHDSLRGGAWMAEKNNGEITLERKEGHEIFQSKYKVPLQRRPLFACYRRGSDSRGLGRSLVGFPSERDWTGAEAHGSQPGGWGMGPTAARAPVERRSGIPSDGAINRRPPPKSQIHKRNSTERVQERERERERDRNSLKVS